MTEDTLTARIEAIQQKEHDDSARVEPNAQVPTDRATAESGQGVQSTPVPERQTCWAGNHKWGTWTTGEVGGGFGRWRACRRCPATETKY